MTAGISARDRVEHQYHVQRRARVERELGFENRSAFELWAFKECPFTYSKGIQMAWHKAHSTKGEVPEGQDEALGAILDIWKSRYVTLDELTK